LKEIIEFNDKNRDKEMPYFGQDLLIKAEAKGPLTEKAYLEALAKNHLMSRSQGIDFALAKKTSFDALIAPNRRTIVADRLCQRRSFYRWLLDGFGRGRLSAHYRAGRLCLRLTRGSLVLCFSLQRTDINQTGVCVLSKRRKRAARRSSWQRQSSSSWFWKFGTLCRIVDLEFRVPGYVDSFLTHHPAHLISNEE